MKGCVVSYLGHHAHDHLRADEEEVVDESDLKDRCIFVGDGKNGHSNVRNEAEEDDQDEL